MRLRRLAFRFVCVLLMAASPFPVQAGQKALLVGIGKYPLLPAAYQLPGPANDVRAMRQFLVAEWGFSADDIRMLVDAEATKAGILGALYKWLPAVTQAGDRVVIYYSGHGSRVRDVSGDERDGMDETFVPSDHDPRNARDGSMLLDDEMAEALERLADRQVVFIADSCHSGTVTRSLGMASFPPGKGPRPRYLPPPLELTRSMPVVRDEEPISEDFKVHLTLSAALPYQLAWEDDGEGVFTRYLIEGLTGLEADLNGNGRTTSAELIEYVRPRTESWCQETPSCRDFQFTPNMDPRDGIVVLQPVLATGLLASSDNGGPGAVSDILPEMSGDEVAVEMFPGRRIRIGEEVSLRLASSVDGHLTLLDLNAAGDLVLLFPTAEDIRRGKSGRIRAGASMTVPDLSYGVAFEAAEPVGRGTLIAIVTEDLVEFGDLLDGHRAFEPMGNGLAFAGAVSERLRKVWTGDPQANRSARWAIGYLRYEIRE